MLISLALLLHCIRNIFSANSCLTDYPLADYFRHDKNSSIPLGRCLMVYWLSVPTGTSLLTTPLVLFRIVTDSHWTCSRSLNPFAKVTCSGIPSAAILSVELLKDFRLPHDSRLTLPRSEVTQKSEHVHRLFGSDQAMVAIA